MNSDKNTVRLLGAAFFVVAVLSITAGVMSDLTLLSGSITDSLVNVASNLTQIRISILLNLFESAAIVALAVLLFVVLSKQNKTLALVALGLWLVEAATLAVSKIGTFALIPLSLEYVAAGAPDSSYFQTLGTFFLGVDNWGWEIVNVFFGLGGILWYSLFYKSRYIPRIFSVWGLVAVSLLATAMVLGWFGVSVGMFVFFPTMLLELTLGPWLMVKGIRPDKIE
jgi:hypothetical protein